jgi:preprotein translocase subunit SecE
VQDENHYKTMSNVISFIKDAYVEMTTKVSWPKFSDLQNSSVLVLVASLIFALVIWVMDYAFQNVLEQFYKAF